MSGDEEKIREIKNNLSEFDLRDLNLANFTPKEEVRFHEYIKGICQRLLGDTIDLDEKKIIFALSDKDETNAAHTSRGEVSIIYITEKLLDLCQNEDQLAFILGHELGHYEERLRQGARKQNSKAEETACDLRAIQKMARGRYNLEEACNIAAEIFDRQQIFIDDLIDPHTNDNSRVNLINAMKKKEKDRIIEEQNIEITQSTPIATDIIKMVHNRPKQSPFLEVLYLQMLQISDENDRDEARIAFWLKSFREHIISNGHSYAMTRDDVNAFALCINRFFVTNDKFADKFLAAVFAKMEGLRNTDVYPVYTDIMHNVLNKIRSSDYIYRHAKIDADEKDSKTAAWLRRYLHGFREAEGEKFEDIINNLEYVKKFVARHSLDGYKGIYVKNFNLLELDFNESDVGKRISPQILKYIRTHINAKDKFVTFSGLTAHKMGSSLILNHEKNNWSLLIDSSGEIVYSCPTSQLALRQIQLISRNIESTKNSLEMIAREEITDIRQKLDILRDAYKIISPSSYKNELSDIFEIRNISDDTNKKILYDDVAAILSQDSKQFFAERLSQTNSDLPYTQKIIDLYAEAIRTAPKEYYNEIFDSLVFHQITHRLSGEDKLVRAFLDNPNFSEELSKTIRQYEAFPEESEGWKLSQIFDMPDSGVHFGLLDLVRKMAKITDFKLKEHLENGGNFDNFEHPFKKDLAKLFGFAPQGDIDEETMLQNLKKTRNMDSAAITLYERAYITYSSYDALKSNEDTNVQFLLGYNNAGVHLMLHSNSDDYLLKSAEKYHVDEQEQEQIKERQAHFADLATEIHDKLWSKIDKEIETGNISANDIFFMTLRNDYHGNRVYGADGFDTIISNHDFEKEILRNIEVGVYYKTSIFSLRHIIKAYEDNTKEGDIYKEKIWPSLKKFFEREDIDVIEKTHSLCYLARYNFFASDYKRYYEVLIGKDGKSGLLKEIADCENEDVKFNCYKELLDKFSRIPDPEIRADVIKNAALSYWKANGQYNDITNPSNLSREVVIEGINKIKNSSIAEFDKIEFLKELSELMQSQKELSLAMKPNEIDLQTSDSNAIIAAYGLDVVAYALQHYPETKVSIQDFLLGEGTSQEASKLVEEIHIALCKEHDKYLQPKILERYLNGEDILNELDSSAKLNPQACLHFKKEFDAAPLEAKALIVNEIITSGKADWEESFNIVSDKLFADAGELGKVGSDFLHRYIAARPNSEKTFYLAAMMAAVNNKSKSADNYKKSKYTVEERNLAKGLRLFLENSGPAGTKLAQAMASYSEVPEFIRYEMQFAKSQANPPARWEIFSGNDDTMDKLLEYGALGKRRGSASFFVTYDLGDKIVKIMRRGAKLKADSEFGIYTEMLQALSAEYQNISSFKRLVQNASDNVRIETDLETGEKQYKYAKELYPESVIMNDVTFHIQVMDWVAHGKDWAIMDKAQGVDFKELQDPYKTAAAKAVFSTELANMLSGKRFDSDRHGGQYKFDTQNNVIGVFDTGSMSMIEPTDKEREALGVVLARTLKALRHNQNVASAFSNEIDRVANELYKNETVPPYLSEFQRGMLALNDFYESLSARDMAECMITAMDNGKHQIHPQIVEAFKLEIKKSLDSHNVSINDLLNPEKTDDLAPEARANRRIGKILFDSVFESISEGKSIDISSDSAQKLVSRLSNSDTDLQIVKGVVRGAYAKLNPNNYTQKDREDLGVFLYKICQIDLRNQKLKKGEALENIIAEVATKYSQIRAYTQNVMKLVSVMAKIPALSSDKLKRAAAFVALTDSDVARGFRKALDEDKSIGFARRMMFKLVPMDFIPHNAKKVLIRAISKRFIANYVSKQLFGKTAKMQLKSNNLEI